MKSQKKKKAALERAKFRLLYSKQRFEDYLMLIRMALFIPESHPPNIVRISYKLSEALYGLIGLINMFLHVYVCV